MVMIMDEKEFANHELFQSLNEEIASLKNLVVKLQTENSTLTERIQSYYYYQKTLELEKENQQLKRENMSLRCAIQPTNNGLV